MLTFGYITTSPWPAPSSGAISSPTETGISHHPASAHARTPRSAHACAYSASRSGTARGIAPSELETRYVVRARMGNSSRKRRSGSDTARSVRLRDPVHPQAQRHHQPHDRPLLRRDGGEEEEDHRDGEPGDH